MLFAVDGACRYVPLEPQEVVDCTVGLLEQDCSYMVGIGQQSDDVNFSNSQPLSVELEQRQTLVFDGQDSIHPEKSTGCLGLSDFIY